MFLSSADARRGSALITIGKLNVCWIGAWHSGHDSREGGQGCVPPDVTLARHGAQAVERNGQLAHCFRRHLGAHAAGRHGQDGAVHLEKDVVESRAVFFPYQAINDGVEAAAGEGQAVGHGEEIGLSPEEGGGEVDYV